MMEKLHGTYREIAESPAGKRFSRFHRRRNERGGRWRSVAMVSVGLVMVVLGVVLSLPPLMPGFLLWIPGLALMASQIHGLARMLDRGECVMRGLYRRIAQALAMR
jgi:hypothetical protein